MTCLLLLLLLLLLRWIPGASPALWVDAVQHITSVMVDVAQLTHHTETLSLRLEDSRVTRSERAVDQILTRLQPPCRYTTS